MNSATVVQKFWNYCNVLRRQFKGPGTRFSKVRFQLAVPTILGLKAAAILVFVI